MNPSNTTTSTTSSMTGRPENPGPINPRGETSELALLRAKIVRSQPLADLGRIATGLAHELDNLLAPILAYAELALRDLDAGHPASAKIASVVQGSLRARELVQSMLAIGRGAPPDRRPIDLGQVVLAGMSLLRCVCPQGVTLVHTAATSLPMALADAGQVHQVLMNLGLNAVQAMHGRSGRIVFGVDVAVLTESLTAATGTLAAGRYLRLSVTDDGIGLDSSSARQLLQPFFTTKDDGQLVGLGLPIARDIVTAHGGAITVEGRPSLGACFRVYLPVAPRGAQD
jgi:signal transduction histidine kinase